MEDGESRGGIRMPVSVYVCVCDSHFKTIESSWRLEMPGFGATKAKLIIQIAFKHAHTHSKGDDRGEESNSFPAECQWTDVDTNRERSSFPRLV